jgi:hypothetical protein
MTTDQDVMDQMYPGLPALEKRPGLAGLRAFLQRFESAKMEAANSQQLDAAHWHLNSAPDAEKTKTWGPIYAAILKRIIEQNPDSDDATNAVSIFDEIELYFISDDSFGGKVDIAHNDQKLSCEFGIGNEFLYALTDIKAAVAFCAKIDMLYPPDQEITDPNKPTQEQATYLKATTLRDAARWPHMVGGGGSTESNEFDAAVRSVCQNFRYNCLAGSLKITR